METVKFLINYLDFLSIGGAFIIIDKKFDSLHERISQRLGTILHPLLLQGIHENQKFRLICREISEKRVKKISITISPFSCNLSRTSFGSHGIVWKFYCAVSQHSVHIYHEHSGHFL